MWHRLQIEVCGVFRGIGCIWIIINGIQNSLTTLVTEWTVLSWQLVSQRDCIAIPFSLWSSSRKCIRKWYPEEQLTADNPVSRSCQTRHRRTNGRTDNVQIFVSLLLLTSLCETITWINTYSTLIVFIVLNSIPTPLLGSYHFLSGRGGRLFVIAGRQFFLVHP